VLALTEVAVSVGSAGRLPPGMAAFLPSRPKMPSQIWRTAGAAASAPKPESGSMTTTTSFGLLQGANDANTEVATLPMICAVPVLPATQTWFSGNPPNAPAAVPWVTTPASAERM
jgi:hypothetical protein